MFTKLHKKIRDLKMANCSAKNMHKIYFIVVWFTLKYNVLNMNSMINCIL